MARLLSVLTIPHSNAAQEQVFSMIFNTEFRTNLELSKSLNSIMVIKINSSEELIYFHKMEFPKEL